MVYRVSDISLEFLEYVPKNSSVYIYGSGQYGGKIAYIIKTFRPDIKILGFIDTYREGENTILFKRFEEEKPECDLVIIGSGMHYEEMERAICKTGYKFITPERFKLQLTEEEKNKIKEVKRMISEGKETYEKVINSRINKDKEFFRNYFKEKNNWENMYVDFVDFSKIRTIIEGGVYKGEMSKKFLEKTNYQAKIYGFDIWGNKFLIEELRENPNLNVIKKALWNKEGILYFPENFMEFAADGTFVVEESYIEKFTQKDKFKRIEATTIDKFISRNDINVDFIKLDVEGADLKVLEGAKNSINLFKPQMSIAVYHELDHLFEIPLFIKELNKDYKICFEHYSDKVSDSIMYFIKK